MNDPKVRDVAVSGFSWSFIETICIYGFQFIVHIILARILSPSEYGIIGIVSIFTVIFTSLIEGGMGQALIQKKGVTVVDFSTVMYSSLFVALLLYICLYLCASVIADFFQQQELKSLLRIISLQLLINPLIEFQKNKYILELQIKPLAYLSLCSNFLSSVLAIILAYLGMDIWSLVLLKLSESVIYCLLIWFLSSWKPVLTFSWASLAYTFSFGYKLVIGNLIDVVYKEFNKLIIAKYFSSIQLGFFTRAEQFGNVPAVIMTSAINKVSYPLFSIYKEDIPALRKCFNGVLRKTMFLSFVSLFLVIAISKSLIVALIGSKWSEAIPYLQLICCYGALYPLHSLNLNVLKVFARTDIILKLEIIKKILVVPVLFCCFYGIRALLIATIIHSIISFFINSYWTNKLLGYSTGRQILNIIPSLSFASIVAVLVYLGQFIVNSNSLNVLLFQLVLFLLLIFIIGSIAHNREYLFFVEQLKLTLSKCSRKSAK